jgi:hypothetical protein
MYYRGLSGIIDDFGAEREGLFALRAQPFGAALRAFSGAAALSVRPPRPSPSGRAARFQNRSRDFVFAATPLIPRKAQDRRRCAPASFAAASHRLVEPSKGF